MRKRLLWLLPLLLACDDGHSTGPAPITCATAANGTQPASVIDLEPGESAEFLTSAAAASCLEIQPQGDSRYLLSVFNVNPDARTTASFQMHGGPPTTLANQVARMPAPPSGAAALRAELMGTTEHAQRAGERLHMELLRADRRLVQQRGNPAAAVARLRARQARAGRLDRAGVSAVFDPQLNDTLQLHVRDIDNDVGDTICVKGFDVRARTVYVGTKTVLFEDIESPVQGQMDEFFQDIGREFDNTIYPMLVENFGDPLAFDAQLGAKGKVLMLFSPLLNEHFEGVAGFVSGCDFYPFDSLPGPDENTVGNDAAIFYAYVPTNNTVDAIADWQAFVRGVLAHETKHLSAYAAKFARGATFLEEAWLEEATAQMASEIYQRTFSHSVWKQPAPFLSSVGCEPPLTMRNGCAGDHPQVMLHHFNYLYEYLEHVNTESPIGDTGEANYGGSWSFVRWTVDQYAPSEAGILQAMTQSVTSFGVANLTSRVDASFGELVANWSLASAAAADPTFQPADPRLAIPSWRQGEIFRGMHEQLILSSTGKPAFPLEYPLVPDSVAFGTFDRAVALLHGGGATFFELHSPLAERQPIEIQSLSGSPLPPDSPIRTAIVRLR